MTQNIKTGAAYIRVSTDDQAELSPDAQLRMIKETAENDGFIIPAEYIFEEKKGISGRKADNRPAFQQMIATAKSQTPPPFQRLYLWKFSRFARNQEESTFYKSILRKKCGIEIKSISEPIADGMFGRLIETIIEWFDEYYSYNLSGEVIRGMTEKALRHGYQSVPSLGYDAVGHGEPFIINEEKYKIVEFIFQSYADGMDMTRIARLCNEYGWKTRRNNPFERRTILRILTNPFYTGIVTWNGCSFSGTHEVRPSITNLFDDVQKRIKQEYRPDNRREISSCRHWLSGLLRCSICGASLSHSRTADPSRRSSLFQCWKYLKGVHKESCSISERRIEQAVLASLQSILHSNTLLFQRIPAMSDQQKDQEKLLSDALIRIQKKEIRIHDAYETGIDSLEEYKEKKDRIRQEKEEIFHQINLLKEQKISSDPASDQEEILSHIQTLYDLLSNPDIDYERKGTAARNIIRQIVVDKQNNEIRIFYHS